MNHYRSNKNIKRNPVLKYFFSVNYVFNYSEQLSSQKNQFEKFMDQRINLLTKVANKRKRKADDSTSGDTVNSSEISLSCLEAEKSKVKVITDVFL